jgi:hypothetical protein
VPLKTAKAKFIEPMLLLPSETLPEGAEWIYELKLDGYRAQGIKTIGKPSLREAQFSGVKLFQRARSGSADSTLFRYECERVVNSQCGVAIWRP